MLVRYPGLSIAGGLAIALVIVCATAAGIFHAVVNSALPFEEGDRIVAIENWDTSASRPAPHDFDTWRAGLTTVTDVGAFRLVTRNIGAPNIAPEPVRVAEISASAFGLAGVAPALGRHLTADDERAGAAPVIVIGHDEWQRRFAGDARLVGRTIQVGDGAAIVVGVMPRGFGFPVNERYWMPLAYAPGDSAAGAPSSMPFKHMPEGVLHVFGKLAPGADVRGAQAELTVIGQRVASAGAGEHLRPRVMPYTRWFFSEWHDGEVYLNQVLLLLVLGIVGANVAVLVYARTATRRVEIALRSALGASRGRIAGQLFAEGLALSGVAAAAGWIVAAMLRTELDGLIPWQLAPFWVNSSAMSATVLAYVLGVALIAAILVGVVPALQATGRRAQSGLQHAAASSAGWKVGRTYGALIVVQVTLAVVILPYAVSSTWTSVRDAFGGPGFPAAEYLTARIAAEPGREAGARAMALVRELEGEPSVSAVTLLAGVPGSEPAGVIEIEGERWLREVHTGRLGSDFKEFFDVPVVAGRHFEPRDADPAMRHIVVNRTFAREVLGGEALGRRIRPVEPGASAADAGPWLEVIGVVEDFPARASAPTAKDARMYLPADASDPRFGLLAVRLRGVTPADFTGRLRALTTQLDPSLQLSDVRPMDVLLREQRVGARIGAWASGMVTFSLLLLSATGLYALMAFTVAQRRREIGIRVALGASQRTLMAGILSRALWQLGLGIVAGVTIVAIWDAETGGELTGGAGLAMLPVVAAFVLLVGLLAAGGPALRALRIHPTEALKEG
jgi:putative ABC transport system permease protein